MTTLDGATDPGDPRCHSSTPGEFAARWNGRTEEERAAHVRWIQEDADTAVLCRRAHRPEPTGGQTPDPRSRDQLADLLAKHERQGVRLIRGNGVACSCGGWERHDITTDQRESAHREHVADVIAAELEARVQAAANQRAAEMQAALDRVEAVCRELDVSFRGSNIMGRIRRAAALASPAPAPHAEEG